MAPYDDLLIRAPVLWMRGRSGLDPVSPHLPTVGYGDSRRLVEREDRPSGPVKNKTSSMEDEKCSFCGASERQVRKLIAGPGVRICNECVGLCISNSHEEGVTTEPPRNTAGASGSSSAGGYRYVIPTSGRRVELLT